MTAIASFDLVVIGGGIHGAGVAQAAAARGFSVLLLEQTALAAGTSSRSSKLIHGGLRYLETGQFGLVRECLRERGVLLRLAPQLVRLKPFYLPIYRGARRGTWQIRTGLGLYAALGSFARDARFTRLSRREIDNLDGLRSDGLKAVFRYYDAQTDDAALTRAVADSARFLGAQVLVPAQFESGVVRDDYVIVRYRHGGITHECSTKTLVNAGGAWANEVLSRITPAQPQLQVRLVQGTHILVPGKLQHGIYYAPSPSDQRPVFVMPWNDSIMVGTTEHEYHGDPAAVKPRPDERIYLLEVLSYYFPRYASAEAARVSSAFAGLRVLPQLGDDLNRAPRDTTLHVDDEVRPRVLTIYGGKLTAYRLTSANVVDRLLGVLPAREIKARTDQLRLV